jgi:hypothetical protein
MKLILALPAVGMLFAGMLNTGSLRYTANEPSHPIATPSSNAPAKMWVTQNTLRSGETLALHFTPPNPTYLGVVDPEGHFFYVVFPQESASGKLQPLVNSAGFAQLDHLDIVPANFKADPYTYGVLENQPVFTNTGTYRFILGENLHVDDPSAVVSVEVKYVK